MIRLNTLLATWFVFASVAVAADEWPRFRGPNGAGLAAAVKLPDTWSEKDIAWKVPVPGVGISSPVVWGDHIYLSSADSASGKQTLFCVNATDGKTLWTREFTAGVYKKHKKNTFATSTPAADADRVYFAYATPEHYRVTALTHDGKEAWAVDLGPYHSNHGFGASPIVYEDMLILTNEPDGDGKLIAVEAATGKTRWSVPRHGKNSTYSTPCVYQPPGKPPELVFTNWQHGMTGVDPKSGKVNWEISVFKPDQQERAVASPVVAGDLVLGSCGFAGGQKHLVAVRPYDESAGGKPKVAWRMERQASHLPTPLVKGDRVFVCTELGMASCVEAATGKVVWEQRVGGNFSGSPVAAGDRIFWVDDNGKMLVFAAGEKYQLLGRQTLEDGTQCTPAVAHGRLYIRTEKHLTALGGR
jgi:outer membrane protein assembly factor BamB